MMKLLVFLIVSVFFTEMFLGCKAAKRDTPAPTNEAPATQPAPSDDDSTSTETAIALEPGRWGGLHMELNVRSDGSSYQLDCAHGTIDQAIVHNSQGNFHHTGTMTKEDGANLVPQVALDTRFDGIVRGNSMVISLTWRELTGELKNQSFVLKKNADATLFRCL